MISESRTMFPQQSVSVPLSFRELYTTDSLFSGDAFMRSSSSCRCASASGSFASSSESFPNDLTRTGRVFFPSRFCTAK